MLPENGGGPDANHAEATTNHPSNPMPKSSSPGRQLLEAHRRRHQAALRLVPLPHSGVRDPERGWSW
ncbi:Uncharacterised protein [Mycobacteroides abscessus subsp. abscessus]|nr:Uncharacterised protein [Mycobacteroides abscessus subsp. abscessus]